MPSQSRPMMFDPQLRAKSAELQAAVRAMSDALLVHETASGSRKRARKEADKAKFYVCVEALSREGWADHRALSPLAEAHLQ